MIGRIIGNYQITALIGTGGMGAVYRGLDLLLEREVAIKALRPELLREPSVIERFRAEAVALARLNHPHITMLHSFLRYGDDCFMVMELVQGQTLESLIRQCGAMPMEVALPLILQILDGLAHAHQQGVIHRDLKPSNLILAADGKIKLMDFGIARVLGTSRLTREGRLIGTIEYMSPEQIRGEEGDARSDLYTLGVLCYEILTGRVPFSSDSEYDLMRAQVELPPPPPRKFAPAMNAHVEQVILRALAKNPAERFQSTQEFQSALLDTSPIATSDVIEAAMEQANNNVAASPPSANAPAAINLPKETRWVKEIARIRARPEAPLLTASRSTMPEKRKGFGRVVAEKWGVLCQWGQIAGVIPPIVKNRKARIWAYSVLSLALFIGGVAFFRAAPSSSPPAITSSAPLPVVETTPLTSAGDGTLAASSSLPPSESVGSRSEKNLMSVATGQPPLSPLPRNRKRKPVRNDAEIQEVLDEIQRIRRRNQE